MTSATRSEGFVLLEALVGTLAAGILGAAVVTTTTLVHARVLEAEVRRVALREAQFRLEEALEASRLAELPTSGSSQRVNWGRTYMPSAKPSIVEIEVEVEWRVGRRSGFIELWGARFSE